MESPEVFESALIFLLAAIIVVPIFRHCRSSTVLGYLTAGVIIGPSALALISDAKEIHILAEFGVVLLLFMIGLELSLNRLKALRRYVFGLGTLQVLITGALITAIALLCDIDTQASIIIGAGLCLSSTAFVVQLLVEHNERTTRFGLVSFAILLLQDLAIVPLLILVGLLNNDETSYLEVFSLTIAEAAAALAIVIILGRLLFRPIFRIIAGTKSTELFVAGALLAILGTGWIMSFAGVSMVLGAFLAGLILAETEYRHQIEADIRPFKGIFLGLFFMTIGISLDLAFIQFHLELVLKIVGALLLGKAIIIALLSRIFGIPWITSTRIGVMLSQGGEFGFVLFGAAHVAGLIETEMQQIMLAVITLSMIATPFLNYFASFLPRTWELRCTDKPDKIDIDTEEIEEHIVIAGFGRVGQTIAKLLKSADIPYLAIDKNHSLVTHCRAQGIPTYYGDASHLHILEAACGGKATAVIVTLDRVETGNKIVSILRNSYPELKIFVRAQDMKHMHLLEKEGATAVIPETIEASLQLGSIAMKSLGVDPERVTEIIQSHRQDDYIRLEEIIN
tara:strand:- start:91499 stop:93196 length:1698 start_codon:yes stop_codon:yes gene_type:complete